MKNNTQTNRLIMYMIVGVDFIILNVLLFLLVQYHPWLEQWIPIKSRLLVFVSNVALLLGEMITPPIIHKRAISFGNVVQRVFQLTLMQGFFAVFLMKILHFNFVGGNLQVQICALMLLFILLSRALERMVIEKYRSVGGNSRRATFIGADTELLNVYHKLKDDLTMGYRIDGYYADEDMPHNEGSLTKLGTLQYFLDNLKNPEKLDVGDELFVCLSRRDKNTIKRISHFCDQQVVRFYYVPVSLETLGMNLNRELIDDIEVFTTYDNPLENPWNKFVKRAFDIVMSIIFLIPTALIFPFIFIIMKIQSPGPILFKQKRTGLDGKDFYCYKFRSMHVNDDADTVQATKDDPRKYPFGNFMRKANIDELPQFLNVLKGDMSIVGPRPHMLAHTEQYSELIDKYMVRHFVKPGVTGFAQVTGYRGETKELWQMEGRVKRDIWYMEHWSFWLDLRIIVMTIKSIVIHDKNAY